MHPVVSELLAEVTITGSCLSGMNEITFAGKQGDFVSFASLRLETSRRSIILDHAKMMRHKSTKYHIRS